MLAWRMSTPSAPLPGAAGPPSIDPPAGAVDPRLAALTASLVARLGRVCRGWDAAAFDALVDHIARTQLRWADQESERTMTLGGDGA